MEVCTDKKKSRNEVARETFHFLGAHTLIGQQRRWNEGLQHSSPLHPAAANKSIHLKPAKNRWTDDHYPYSHLYVNIHTCVYRQTYTYTHRHTYTSRLTHKTSSMNRDSKGEVMTEIANCVSSQRSVKALTSNLHFILTKSSMYA